MSEKKSPTNEPEELSTEQRVTIAEWLEEKWGPDGGSCSVCKESTWAIGPYLITPVLYSEKGFWAGGPLHPEVLVNCTNCGHAVHFNAIAIGLAEADKEQEESSQAVGNG